MNYAATPFPPPPVTPTSPFTSVFFPLLSSSFSSSSSSLPWLMLFSFPSTSFPTHRHIPFPIHLPCPLTTPHPLLRPFPSHTPISSFFFPHSPSSLSLPICPPPHSSSPPHSKLHSGARRWRELRGGAESEEEKEARDEAMKRGGSG